MDVKDYFLNRDDKLESEEFKRVYDLMLNKISPSKLNLLTNISFVMFKPNATLAGQIPDLIESFKNEGIFIFRHQLKYFSDSELDNLYMFVKMKYSESWWVMKRVYGLAPCFPAIIIGEKGNYPHLSARVRNVVGPTTPIVGSEHQLRYKFRGTHRLFNTIHATDDPASAVRESLVFFNIDDVNDALSAVAEQKYSSKAIDIPPHIPLREFNFNNLRNKTKRSMLEMSLNTLSSVDESEIQSLLKILRRLQEVISFEEMIIHQQYPLRQEYNKLAQLSAIQRTNVQVGLTEARKIMSKNFRSHEVVSTKFENVATAVGRVAEIINLLVPLVDDLQLMSMPDIELYLSKLISLGIKLDKYDEVIFLGCWAGSYNELLEIGTKWPLE